MDLSGEQAGAASHAKLVGNVLVIQMIESVAEAHVLAEKTGLAAESLHKVINAVFPGAFGVYSKRMMTGSYCREVSPKSQRYEVLDADVFQPVIAIGLAKAVAHHIQEMAEQSGTALPSYQIACQHMDLVEEHAGKSGDVAGIYGIVRIASGLQFEN